MVPIPGLSPLPSITEEAEDPESWPGPGWFVVETYPVPQSFADDREANREPGFATNIGSPTRQVRPAEPQFVA